MECGPRLDPAAVPDALRLPLSFDAAAMAADCAALAGGDWIDHFVRRNYDGDWSVIPLRARADAQHPIMMIQSDPEARNYVDTPFLAACPAIRAALAQFGSPLLSVRLMRLGPGSRIKEHRDPELSFEDGAVRLHVPVITHDGVAFRLNGRRVPMAAGTCWYLRLSDPHAVENPGPGERVHLVVDAQVTPALSALFAAATATAAPETTAATRPGATA
ncbi:aspartyl beta-hydroxylase [Methylobacterium platani]|uniref:Aspartyl beta-hydroxylase n=2 Tax=Methylobacterium platani TaxID=427683 RepID=A0A179SGJ2_9HYPH|nr:aspartyl beta-hydroxylase [Methylobacterium platani]